MQGKNNKDYYKVHDKGGWSDNQYEDLMNAIVKSAADDLLESMLKDNGVHTNKSIIINTPVMGHCNDIPKIPGRMTIRRLHMYRFPGYYKKMILEKFDNHRKEQFGHDY